VLVNIKAAGVNPIDTKIREGSRFVSQHLHLPAGLGFDLSGIVASCGKNVTQFTPDDHVLGKISRLSQPGTYAEYCLMKESELTIKPRSLSWYTSACLPIAGLTAWQALFDHGQLQSDERVLIHGGAGGVGHLAVQLAKRQNAYVITTATSIHHEFLKQLGADEIIDYKTNAFEDMVSDLDLVVDLVGGEIGSRSLQVVHPEGRLITVPTITAEDIVTKAQALNLNASGMLVKNDSETLETLAKLVHLEQITVKIYDIFQLCEANQAHEVLQQRHIEGKIALDV